VRPYVVILTMSGGGFAVIPAYLADEFGTAFVGAIHGRLLAAWSAAGRAGPVLMSYLRDWQLAQRRAPGTVYNTTMQILAGLLLLGFLSNLLVRPVAVEHFMSDEDLRRDGSQLKEGGVAVPLIRLLTDAGYTGYSGHPRTGTGWPLGSVLRSYLLPSRHYHASARPRRGGVGCSSSHCSGERPHV